MEIKSDVLTISITIGGRQRLHNLVLRIIKVAKYVIKYIYKVAAPIKQGCAKINEKKIGIREEKLIFRKLESKDISSPLY